jgi:hypothetical protein
MEITKLTITPLFKDIKPFCEYQPSKELATGLIKDRLISVKNYEPPKVLKRIPKKLRDFVKPNCKYVKKTDFYA